MKKIVIATLVGTLVNFLWLTLAWMALPVHENALKYTPAQDEIMQVLSKHLSDDAVFALPTVDPDSKTYMADAEKMEKESVGKPWAMIFYHPQYKAFSIGYLLNAITLTLISVLLMTVILYLTRTSLKTFANRFLIVMLIALFCIFQSVLDDWNWWSFPTHFIQAQIFDLMIAWVLTGMWLAWYVRDNKEKLTTENN